MRGQKKMNMNAGVPDGGKKKKKKGKGKHTRKHEAKQGKGKLALRSTYMQRSFSSSEVTTGTLPFK